MSSLSSMGEHRQYCGAETLTVDTGNAVSLMANQLMAQRCAKTTGCVIRAEMRLAGESQPVPSAVAAL